MKQILTDRLLKISFENTLEEAQLKPGLEKILTFSVFLKETGEDGSIVETEEKENHLIAVSELNFVCMAGFFQYICQHLTSLNQKIIWEDRRVKTLPREIGYNINPDCLGAEFSLREDYQLPVLKEILKYRKGIVNVPTRGGKTEIMIGLINTYLEKENPEGLVTFLVKDTNLVSNFVKRLDSRKFNHSYSTLSAGGGDPSSKVLCCVINSAYNRATDDVGSEIQVRLLKTDLLIVDECHHVGGDMYTETISTMFKVHFPDIAVFFSGSPYYTGIESMSDHRDARLLGLSGGSIVQVSDEYLIHHKYKAQPNVIWLKPKYKRIRSYNYLEVYRAGVKLNLDRNLLAAKVCKMITDQGFRCLVLVQYIDHGKNFLKKLSNLGVKSVFKSGKECHTTSSNGNIKPVNTPFDAIDEFNSGKIPCLVATSIYNTGTDFPGCNWMVLLAAQGKDNDVLNRQRTSRVLCPRPNGLNAGFIIDFYDHYHTFLKGQSDSRYRFYCKENYVSHDGGIDKLAELLNLAKAEER